ncbi:MAG: phosphate acyltransferase PlsX [Steroidobacteraceae bacterium]
MLTSAPLAIDAMSGDLGASACVGGTLLALQALPDLRIVFTGQTRLIEPLLAGANAAIRSRITLREASDVVAMDDAPRDAVRRKKGSSMRVAVDLVKSGEASACVSAGNTGALMAIAHFVLRTIEGVDRAAIISAIPSITGHTHMLDLGANARATGAQLAQFAAMGNIVAREVHGVVSPRVGLLNIGEEDSKGHEVVQEAHALIAASGINYVGFVEGNVIFSGEVDVVVTDGFTGNVALKTMEGLAMMVRSRMREEFSRNAMTKLAGLAASGVLRRVALSLDPGRYNGACMVGLNGVVVKSHGRADERAFAQAVKFAAHAVEQRLPGHIAAALNRSLAERG